MDTQIDRFMCSQTVMLELQGIPAVYFNSLIGAPNNLSGVQDTGRARTINREKWTATQLQSMLDDASSPRSRIFHRYRALLRLRRAHPAFSPRSTQQVIDLGPCIFAVMRRNSDPDEAILCVSNFTDQPQTVHFQQAGKALPHGSHTMDLISRKCRVDKEGRLSLKAYETVWLTRA
jgi:sucrose phosphorylase